MADDKSDTSAELLDTAGIAGPGCDTADEAGLTYDIGHKKLRDYYSENHSFFAFRMLQRLLSFDLYAIPQC